ncbi:MAG: D-aminoacylase [Pirellulales bacterium]
MFDLLIQGGEVVDGLGSPRQASDVAVRGERIVGLGKFTADSARRVIDARGLVTTPGFIDVHNHTDGWLLKQPNFASKTLQGVTTEVLGSDGISYAPTTSALAPQWIHHLRSLNGLELADYSGWESLADYYNLLDGRTAQNVVAQIPYANLRMLASGWSQRKLDDLQIKLMQYAIVHGMESGAVGVSTGLDYVNEFYASTDELTECVAAMRPYNGLYVTHVRYKKGLVSAVKEAVDICRRAGVRLHISHLKADAATQPELLAYLDEAAREVDLSFDVYPYMPGSTMLHSLLPNEVWDDGPLAAAAKLLDPDVRRRFGEYLHTEARTKIHVIRIAWLPSKANARFQGMSLAEYIAAVGRSPADALCDLLIEENMSVLCVFHVGDDALVEPFLKHDKFMFGSDGIYQPDGPVHPRHFGGAARMVGRIVRERRWLTLEEAVRKMTSVPAARFGLVDRGEVREGAFADLAVFDPDKIDDPATFDNPRQHAVGMHEVLVNGTSIVSEGRALEKLDNWPGRWLKPGGAS